MLRILKQNKTLFFFGVLSLIIVLLIAFHVSNYMIEHTSEKVQFSELNQKLKDGKKVIAKTVDGRYMAVNDKGNAFLIITNKKGDVLAVSSISRNQLAQYQLQKQAYDYYKTKDDYMPTAILSEVFGN